MAGMSNAVENKVLDHLLGGTTYDPPDTLVLALTTVAVTETDTGATITKAGYTGYTDFALTHATHWAAASSGSKANGAAIGFPQNGGVTTSTVIGFAVLNGTDVVVYGTVPSSAIGPNVTPEFAIGDLIVTAD